MRVLGISIGTRSNGTAVLNGAELEAAQIHSFNERWSKGKIAAIIAIFDRYTQKHAIEKIVVKTPKSSHYTLALKQLIKAIDTYVKSQGCMLEYTTIEHIKAAEPAIKTRRHIREFVVAKYPELIHEMRKDIKNKQPYYMKLFEATIVADISTRTTDDR
ncbi:MAG: hypothetical protein ACP5N7_00675 [Candidatus Pacearchaeota archaeon]